ncbi:MAG: DUF6273 domain-containing protein [bacterium]|nr:DUF6273 domain-containing protein [bacterium]
MVTWQNAKRGDIIEFGCYPFAADGAVMPIKWIVLGRSEQGILVLSLYGLDVRRYHDKERDITWQDCDLRRWLNTDFIGKAFSDAERQLIAATEVYNDDNEEFATFGGADTQDYLFVLSLYEFEEFCAGELFSVAQPTPYARQRMLKYEDSEAEELEAGGWWWLRTPGSEEDFALEVGGYGEVGAEGTPVHWLGGLVRPALQLKLFD